MTVQKQVTWLPGLSHLFTHSYMSMLPAVLVVITAENSMSFLDIGIIANIGYFLYGLGAFPAGWLADRYGSKRVLTVGVAGMAISSILVGVLPGAIGFALSYALLGFFASIHHPAGLALIARRAPVKGKALAVHGVMGNVGLFLAPLTAGLMVMVFGTWRAAYILFGLFGIVFAIFFHRTRVDGEENFSFKAVSTRRPREEKEQENKHREVPRDKEQPGGGLPFPLILLFMGSILSGFIFRGSLTFFPLLLQREVHFIASHDEPVVMAGMATTAVLSLGFIGAWFGGWLNDKIKRPEIIPVVLFVIVTPALYYMSQWIDTGLIVVSAVFSLFYYAWQPSQNYLIAKYTRKTSHGKGFGVNFFLLFGIGSVATVMGGYVSDHYGVDYFYLAMAWISLVYFLITLILFKVARLQGTR